MSNVNDIIKVKVTDTKPYAAFIETKDGVKGLLHISEISDNFVKDIENFVRKGDEINVKILEIDNNDGFLRVSYKRVPENEQFSSHQNKRQGLISDEEEFAPLKNHLNEWIDNTISKMEDKK
jgi:predicted RNA-binding protein with RPS1 domain